ncbi:glutamate receptor 2.8-like isoform X1 [Juglans microcarpa x Juglans regia]|uniref:glutamate receptor 2.8-like isoform X1 n=1 Tax=Juglans microcarpa x Juglans regia TaxID=2249226 RepID=UPI001B7E74E7|nr:glutamate receptor 2.8-like isoform X1 [Juglans microcarpa x Juglans regia]
MASQKHLLYFLSVLLLTLRGEPSMAAKEVIPVGVVLDLNSPVGRVAEHCMSMALSDFYAANDDYNTRLALLTKDSGNDVIAAASAALELMKNDEVQAIIGPQSSAQARFVIELGRKAQVPILSFSATSPSLSPVQNPFFIRTAQDDSAQVKAITAIVQAYGWREIVLIYEDTDYGNGLIPYLMDAFLEIDTRVPYRSVIPPSSNNNEIAKEISKLKEDHTRIFLVHMTAFLGSKLFVLANNAGMLRGGFAWIFTEGLSDLEDRIGSKVKDSMQGVLGLRPYIPRSKHFKDFKRRLKRNLTSSKPNIKITGNLFGLWAYDTVFALAIAVEKAGIVHSNFLKKNASQSNVDLAALGISEIGPTLRDTILTTKFQGLSGKFQLVKGQLEPSAFEILNVIGKTERVIGYWTRQRGLSQELDDNSEVANSISKDSLKQPIWPGDTTEQPPKLRIGVPVKRGFDEFLKVEWDPRTDKPIISGFSHDVFIAVLKALPFPLSFEYIPFMNKDRQSAGTIDELIYQIKLQNYDAVVGATTIVANRSLYVDFTLPYSESGVSMVVPVKDDEKNKFWIFLKPLSLDLWVTTFAAFVFTGLVIWVLEHRINREFRGPPDQHLGMIFWFSFSTLVFAHREKLLSNWSRFVMIVWIFLVLILTQSYTASLASMLTVQRLQPTFVDVKEIKKNGYFVGYQNNSYVEGLLIKQLNFDRSKLKPFSTHEEYHEALSKGTQNGGVAAVFDEIPYIKLFLAKYCSGYTMVGPTYKSDGFGFAFPLGSPLVPYISRAILNVTQDTEKLGAIERTYFSSRGSTNCQDPSASISSNSPSLSLHSFGGLFIITGTVSLISLLVCFFKFFGSHWPTLSNSNPESTFWSKLIEMAKHFDRRDPSSHLIERNTSMAHPIAGPRVIEPST